MHVRPKAPLRPRLTALHDAPGDPPRSTLRPRARRVYADSIGDDDSLCDAPTLIADRSDEEFTRLMTRPRISESAPLPRSSPSSRRSTFPSPRPTFPSPPPIDDMSDPGFDGRYAETYEEAYDDDPYGDALLPETVEAPIAQSPVLAQSPAIPPASDAGEPSIARSHPPPSAAPASTRSAAYAQFNPYAAPAPAPVKRPRPNAPLVAERSPSRARERGSWWKRQRIVVQAMAIIAIGGTIGIGVEVLIERRTFAVAATEAALRPVSTPVRTAAALDVPAVVTTVQCAAPEAAIDPSAAALARSSAHAPAKPRAHRAEGDHAAVAERPGPSLDGPQNTQNGDDFAAAAEVLSKAKEETTLP